MSDGITFWQLVALMAVGSGRPDVYRGDVFSHDEHGEPATTRVFRKARSIRREATDGRPLFVSHDGKDLYVWLDGADVPTHFAGNAAWAFDDSVLTERRSLIPARRYQDWEGEDFTRLAGPISSGTYLGRTTWDFELAPPPHKPFPSQQTVDAETGILLRTRCDGLGTVTEFRSFEPDIELPDELFRWDGEVLAPADHSRDHDRDLAERAQWLAEQGIVAPTLSYRPELMVNHKDDEGRFYVSVTGGSHGCLARRLVGDVDFPGLTNHGWPHWRTWTVGPFEYFVGTDRPVTDEELASWQHAVPTSD